MTIEQSRKSCCQTVVSKVQNQPSSSTMFSCIFPHLQTVLNQAVNDLVVYIKWWWWWWLGLMLLYIKEWWYQLLSKPDVPWKSVCLCLFRPVPGSLSSLLHLRNRQRQPLPASMPGTLPDPTMPGSSAVLMPVSTTTESTEHIHSCVHSHMQR